MPRFSVIIPTYNRIDLLKEALASVWVQTFTDYEVIVVDDGSTDGTWEYLQSLEDRVKAFRQQNAGPGAARNLGARHAGGDYLAFLDSDDRWFPWSLQTYSKLIDKYELPAVVSGRIDFFATGSELSNIVESQVQEEYFADFFSTRNTGYFVGAGMSVLNKSMFLKVGGYTENQINCEDHDLIMKMGNSRGFVQVISPITLGWRRHEGNATLDVFKSIKGSHYLIEQELLGKYPGGRERSRQRREIISRHVRPVILECISRGLKEEAWNLYKAIFPWHVVLRRWKFLAGFWFKMLVVRA